MRWTRISTGERLRLAQAWINAIAAALLFDRGNQE